MEVINIPTFYGLIGYNKSEMKKRNLIFPKPETCHLPSCAMAIKMAEKNEIINKIDS